MRQAKRQLKRREQRPSAAAGDDDDEELVDTTAILTLHSRRTERWLRQQGRRHKSAKRLGASSTSSSLLLDLPYELILDIVSYLRPGDALRLSLVCRSVYRVLREDDGGAAAAQSIMALRYPTLHKCLRLPILMRDVELSAHADLQSDLRQDMLAIHRKPYQHIQPPDPALVCTCLTCLLRWNSLCLAVDFSRWQDSLDRGDPIPTVPRGQQPAWNTELVAANAAVVTAALGDPLQYARILEVHLTSTLRSIRRHAQNKGNRRRRFRMTLEDENAGTDAFLERSGPPTLDFPFHRDNYYMLEAYLPNRSWNGDQERWMYVPAEQHEMDVEFVLRGAQRRRAREQETTEQVAVEAKQ